MSLEGWVSSLGVESRNYRGGGEIYVRNFGFVPQIFGGVILLSSKITPQIVALLIAFTIGDSTSKNAQNQKRRKQCSVVLCRIS